MLDYKIIKQDFPILQTLMNGKPLVFLDSAASSQKPQKVIDAFSDFYRCRNANIHRGAYRLSYEATDLYELTRKKLKKFLNAEYEEEIIFTRNTTESINLIAYSYAMKFLKEGDEILVSELEHHSNLVPWMMVAERKGVKLKHIPLTEDLRFDYEKLPEILNEKIKIISVAHMSNAVGTIHSLKKISEIAKSMNAIFVVDGAQGASHLPVNVQEIGCDFYALSAHKMLGPTGVGVLYGKKEVLDKMDPFLGGGDMILTVWKDGFKSAGLPNKFEAGTPNIADVVAFAVAIDYLNSIGLENIHQHEIEILKYALEKISDLPFVKTYGPENLKERGGILSFTIEGIHPHDIGSILDEEGIAIRAGHHCAEPLMRKLGISGTARASFYLYNGTEDIDMLVKGIEKVINIFKLHHKKYHSVVK